MLVLTRKENEAIVLHVGNEVISVTVLSVSGDRVRIGVKAPKSIPVHRAEVQRRIHGQGFQPSEVASAPTAAVEK